MIYVQKKYVWIWCVTWQLFGYLHPTLSPSALWAAQKKVNAALYARLHVTDSCVPQQLTAMVEGDVCRQGGEALKVRRGCKMIEIHSDISGSAPH